MLKPQDGTYSPSAGPGLSSAQVQNATQDIQNPYDKIARFVSSKNSPKDPKASVPGLASKLSKEAQLLFNGVQSDEQVVIIDSLFEDPKFLALLHQNWSKLKLLRSPPSM